MSARLVKTRIFLCLLGALAIRISAETVKQNGAAILWEDEFSNESSLKNLQASPDTELKIEGGALCSQPKSGKGPASISLCIPKLFSDLQFRVKNESTQILLSVQEGAPFPWLWVKPGLYTVRTGIRNTRENANISIYSLGKLVLDSIKTTQHPFDGVYFSASSPEGEAKAPGNTIKAGDTVKIEMPLTSFAERLELSFYKLNMGEDWRFKGLMESVEIPGVPPFLYDDGTHGDELAKDNIYSCSFKMPLLNTLLKTPVNAFLASIHFFGQDTNDKGYYYGVCPFNLDIEACQETVAQSANDFMVFDFGKQGSVVFEGAVGIDGADKEGKIWKWSKAPNAWDYGQAVGSLSYLDTLMNDWVTLRARSSCTFNVKVAPGKYKVITGIGGHFLNCWNNGDFLNAEIKVNGNQVFTRNIPEKDFEKERFKYINMEGSEATDIDKLYEIYVQPHLKDVETEVDVKDGNISIEVAALSDKTQVGLNYIIVYPADSKECAVKMNQILTRRKENFKSYWGDCTPGRDNLANKLTLPKEPSKNTVFVRQNPYNYIYLKSLPEASEITGEAVLKVAPGQVGSLYVGLHAVANLKNVKPELALPSEIPAENRSFYYVMPYRYAAAQGRQTWVAPNHFAPPGERNLAQGNSYGYWLNLRIPDRMVPGAYAGKIVFKIKNSSDLELPVKIEVMPFKLPELQDHVIALIKGSSFEEMKFCKELGCTTASIDFSWPSASKFIFDEKGNISGFKQLGGRSPESIKAALEDYKRVGFLSNIPIMAFMTGTQGGLPKLGKFEAFSPQYQEAMKFSLSYLQKKAEEILGARQIIIDITGEQGYELRAPTRELLDSTVELIKLQNTVPGIINSERANCPAEFETYYPYLQLVGVRGEGTWAVADKLSDFGQKKPLYTYSVSGRFANGIKSWAHGAKGNYKEWLLFREPFPGNDFLCDGACGGIAHAEAMDGPGGRPISTIRAEAWRASIIDRQYLRLLEQEIKKSPDSPTRQNASNFMKLLRSEVLGIREEGGGSYWLQGNEGWHGIRMDVVRTIIAELVQELKNRPIANASVPEFKLDDRKKADLTAKTEDDFKGLPVPEEAPAAYNCAHWLDFKVGQSWESQKINYDGLAWYRIGFDLPEGWENAVISFGAVDESAWVYLNGKFVGEHGNVPTGEYWHTPFIMPLKGLMQTGKNVLAVRVRDRGAMGGIWKPVHIFKTEQDAKEAIFKNSINLAGTWKFIARPEGRNLSLFELDDGLFYHEGTDAVIGNLTIFPETDKEALQSLNRGAVLKVFSDKGAVLFEEKIGKLKLYSVSDFIIPLKGLKPGIYMAKLFIETDQLAAQNFYIIPQINPKKLNAKNIFGKLHDFFSR